MEKVHVDFFFSDLHSSFGKNLSNKELFAYSKAGNVEAKKELALANVKILLEEVKDKAKTDIDLLELLSISNSAFEKLLEKCNNEIDDYDELFRNEIRNAIYPYFQ